MVCCLRAVEKKVVAVLVTVALGMVFVAMPAFADSSSDKAMALVKKAVEYCKANGKDKALSAFNDPKGQFVDGELYIFAYDFNGKNLAHGAKADAVGKNFLDLQDTGGKYIVKDMIALSKTKGTGWVDYKYKNPTTSAVEAKSSYVEKIDDYFVGCGVYKPTAAKEKKM